MLGRGTPTWYSCHLLQVHHQSIPYWLKLYRDHLQWRSKWYPQKVDLTLKWSCRMIQQFLGKKIRFSQKMPGLVVFYVIDVLWFGGFRSYVLLKIKFQFAAPFEFVWGTETAVFLFCVCVFVCVPRMVLFFFRFFRSLMFSIFKDHVSLAILCDIFGIPWPFERMLVTSN